MTTRKALKEADRTWKDVSRLLLVGGSSRMPMVQELLESESGLKVDRSLSADESVAHGAAIYAGILLSTDQRLQSNITVQNVSSHDLGLLGVDKETGGQRRSIMIPRNTRLPVKKGKRFATSRQNQSSVSVKIVEGGDDTGRHSTLIGNCIVRDLPRDLPAATPVDVFFNYGDDGCLQVSATLPTVGTSAAMTIERDSGLSESELTDWSKRIAIGLLKDPASSEKNAVPAVVTPQIVPTIQPGPALKTVQSSKPSQTVQKQPVQQKKPAVPKPVQKSSEEQPTGGGWKARRQQIKPGDTE